MSFFNFSYEKVIKNHIFLKSSVHWPSPVPAAQKKNRGRGRGRVSAGHMATLTSQRQHRAAEAWCRRGTTHGPPAPGTLQPRRASEGGPVKEGREEGGWRPAAQAAIGFPPAVARTRLGTRSPESLPPPSPPLSRAFLRANHRHPCRSPRAVTPPRLAQYCAKKDFTGAERTRPCRSGLGPRASIHPLGTACRA